LLNQADSCLAAAIWSRSVALFFAILGAPINGCGNSGSIDPLAFDPTKKIAEKNA
jgi:hypothetical protein